MGTPARHSLGGTVARRGILLPAPEPPIRAKTSGSEIGPAALSAFC
jgi:hypothetical protein